VRDARPGSVAGSYYVWIWNGEWFGVKEAYVRLY
jgi:hypothetical protein